MPPQPTASLGSHPGRVFIPLRAGALTEDALAAMTYRDYADGDIRVYCDAKVAPAAPAGGQQAGSVVACVSCNQHAAPSPAYDFSSVSGCQNWWMRFSPILSVAAEADLPLALAPYVSVLPLRSLSAAQNHALGMVSWCAKMRVTHRFGTSSSEDAASGRQRTELKLQVKDDSGGRAFLLLQDDWATQCAKLQERDTLIVSGAFLRPLECEDPESLHPSHSGFDLVLHKDTAPEGRVVVIFPLGTSSPPTVVLSHRTFGREDLFPPTVQQTGQRQPLPLQSQGFVSAAQHAANQAAAPVAGAAAPAVAAAAAAGGGRAKRQKVEPVYNYVDLGSLAMSGQQNIYGIISEFRMPRKTRGTDYMCENYEFCIINEKLCIKITQKRGILYSK